METKLKVSEGDLWRGMQFYYSMDLSMIWSRLEKEIVGGEEKKEKTPLGQWKRAQKNRFTLEHLAKVMDKANVPICPTIITGTISGNLEVIDVDVKHWPGIDALFFSEIKALWPDLFAKLRIHKTMSGGFHILYRCEEPIPSGNKKLACQLDENGKPKEAGLETRGEGGYILCPPGAGYSVHQDVLIPTITRAERNALIQLAQLFDERKKTIVQPRQKSTESIYDENPFEHFKSSAAAEQILLDHGWKEYQETQQWIHFTRPEKESGVSASFHKQKRFYHIFTSSTLFENEKNYSPATVLTLLKYNGNYKESYRYFVAQGFGRVKPEHEKKIIPRMVASKADVPPNFSDQAKEEYEKRMSQHNTLFPYGVFWQLTQDDEFIIMRPLIIRVATMMGLAIYNGNPILIEKPYFRKLKDEREAYDMLLSYIKGEEEEVYNKIYHSFDKFWEHSGRYTISRLTRIEKNQILRSSFYVCYKVFRDKILCIDKDGIRTESVIEDSEKFINRDDVIDREWREVEDWEGCKYADFLSKAVSLKGIDLMQVIGYLCFDYKDETEGYIIALLEEVESRKGGGSGKGLFCQLLGLWVRVKTIDGGMLKNSNKDIFQSLNGEPVVHFNDVWRRIDLGALKAWATEGTERKVLYKNIETISPEDMPKLILSGQFGLNTFDDGGVGRRIQMVVFTNYFNEERTPIMEYGGKLPGMWSEEDWCGYDTFIAKSIQAYLRDRRLNLKEKMSEGSHDKNFDQTYSMGGSELREWLEDKMPLWTERDFITSEELQHEYDKFCREQNIKNDMRIKRLHEAIGTWCGRKGYEYNYGKQIRVDGERIMRVSSVKKSEEKEDIGYPVLWDEEEMTLEEDVLSPLPKR